jgi:hypothetical protein
MATAALATNTALAETMVNVPFSFTVNGKNCPAGPYSVARDTISGVVTLKNDDWKRSFMWIASSGDSAPGDSRVILRFDEDGQAHTLQTVQYGALITHRLDGSTRRSEGGPTRVVQGR